MKTSMASLIYADTKYREIRKASFTIILLVTIVLSMAVYTAISSISSFLTQYNAPFPTQDAINTVWVFSLIESWIAFLGFICGLNCIRPDEDSGANQIILSLPISRPLYICTRFLSMWNFLVLYSVTSIITVLLMSLFYGKPLATHHSFFYLFFLVPCLPLTALSPMVFGLLLTLYFGRFTSLFLGLLSLIISKSVSFYLYIKEAQNDSQTFDMVNILSALHSLIPSFSPIEIISLYQNLGKIPWSELSLNLLHLFIVSGCCFGIIIFLFKRKNF